MTIVTTSYREGVNGYSGVLDTVLRQSSPSTADGASTTLRVDLDSGSEVQALLAFDNLFGSEAGQIPHGATITSATLTLQATNGSAHGSSLHRMLVDWDSETATWNSLRNGVQTDGTEALSAADLNSGSVALGSQALDVTSSLQAWAKAGTTAEAHNAANHGWLIQADSPDGWSFNSSEGTASPLLSVTYSLEGPEEDKGTAGGVAVIQSGGSTALREGGATDSFTVALTKAPTADVIITIVDTDEVALSRSSLTFTSANWQTPQTVTLTATDDSLVERTETSNVTLTASSRDASYDDFVIAPVSVTVTDNDTKQPPPVGVIRVPDDFATIQDAVDAARDGDTVLVGPGTYDGGIVIGGKSITLTSQYELTGDRSLIDQTIISGGSPAITVKDNAPNTTVKGFHFVDSDYGIELNARDGRAIDNFFDDIGGDAVSFEETGGVARGNRFYSVEDDGVDVDGATANVLIEGNSFQAMGNDGIEIRNFNYTGPHVTISIRDNSIVGSLEDGIQIIDYSKTTNRTFVIEGNLIRDSAYVGLGLMDKGETDEDFRAANMPELIQVFNNTFDGNRYGITGGDNLVAVNNIISNSKVMGLKSVDGNSVVANTLFFGNAVDQSGSNVDSATSRSGDPLYTSDYELRPGSAAIDAGTSSFAYGRQTVLDVPSAAYGGETVDVGWSESWI